LFKIDKTGQVKMSNNNEVWKKIRKMIDHVDGMMYSVL